MSLSDLTRTGVVLPVRVDPAGVTGPTPGQVRGPRWRRVAPGWWVPAVIDSSHLDQRIVEAITGMPDDAAVTGWASFGWRGARWFHGRAADGHTLLDVPVALDRIRGVRRRRGVELSEDWLFGDDVEQVDGLRVTIPERAAGYEVCRASSLTAAVRTLDMAAASDLLDLAAMGGYAERLAGRPGVRLLRRALAMADENAWSPQEVTMRLAWRARVPCWLRTNRPVFDLRGRHLLTPDLLDEEAGVAGEYDGLVHLEEGTRRRDLDREALYREHRIEVVTMMSAQRADAASFGSRLLSAYARAAERRDAPRTWTTQQPAWWVDTSTVERRRGLTDEQRTLWLRRRVVPGVHAVSAASREQ